MLCASLSTKRMPRGDLRHPPELAIAAVSTAGYCGFLSGPPVIGLVAEWFGLGTGFSLVAIALAIVAFGVASIRSGGIEKRWTVSLNDWN